MNLNSTDQKDKTNKSLGELFGELGRETATLVRQEVQLAKTEMMQKAVTFGRGAAFVAVGGVLAFVGFLTLVAAIVLFLAQYVTPWLAALIVAGGLFVVGGALAFKALMDFKKEGIAPTQTIASLQEDARWAKEQISS